jgi:hypothetical protein
VESQAVGVAGFRTELDTEAEVYALFIAGMGVKVVGGAVVEFVPEAKFAANEEAQSNGAEAGGDPAEGFKEGGFPLILKGVFGGRGRDILKIFAQAAGARTELHNVDDSAGLQRMGVSC